MALQTMEVTIEGTRPLLMGNGRVVDPLDPYTQAIKVIDSIPSARRTDENKIEADKLRWIAATYTDENGYLILPADNFQACLQDAGKMFKLGKKVASGVAVIEDSPLIGVKKKAEELVNDPEYTLRKPVRRNGGTAVISVRPRFKKWGARFTVQFDDSIIGKDEMKLVLDAAGLVGIGSWKQRFGKFVTKYKG